MLVTRFGKLVATLTQPGWHWLPDRILPWVKVPPRLAAARLPPLHATSTSTTSRGTTVHRRSLARAAHRRPRRRRLFDVADWDRSLQNLVSHAAISILGNREFQQILCDRTELGELLTRRHRRRDRALGHRRSSRVHPQRQPPARGVAADVRDDRRAARARQGRHRGGGPAAGRAARGRDERRSRRSSPRPRGSTRPRSVAPTPRREDPEVFEAYSELYELSLAVTAPDRGLPRIRRR